MKRLSLTLACVLGLALAVVAQSPVQQSATRLDAGLRCDSQTGTTTQTLTLQNPGPGLSDYITSLVVTIEATGVIAAANPIAVTSTGINGTSPTFGSNAEAVTTTGQVESPIVNLQLPIPIKANANTAPTFAVVAPTNGVARLTACYYSAP